MRVSSHILGGAFCAASLVHAIQVQERQANWTVGQVVQTSSGPVTGHPASNSTDVSEYLGIPFAVPPVGDLRWTAPQRFNGTDPINGTSFGFSCPIATSASGSASTLQSLNITQSGLEVLELLAQAGDKFSEDCLTINVWTKPQTGDSQKAVLVWIYGGGFSTGNSDNPGYNGQYFAEQEDVVLVSFNYRLNVFGFPGIPNATQNLGLLDQRLAIEWVRDNIAAFGGDPSRITIFGQSAGSASVDYYTYAWASDPIVHSYIEESGSVFGPAPGLGPITADVAAGSWLSLSSALGCGSPNSTNSSSTAILSCMKSQPMPAIVSAMGTMDASSQSPIPSNFGPTVDNVVVFSNYTAQSMAGNFSTLPLLLGNADYEAGLFRILDALKNVSLSDAAWDAFNSDGFVCPCATRANFSLANKVPTWRYRWFGAFPNTELTTIPFSGAWHASELPVLFNNVPFGAGVPLSTDAEVQIGDYIRGAWAAFAKDPVNGLTSYQDGWPMYDPIGQTLIRLGFNNQTGANLAMGDMYDGACAGVVSVSVGGNGTSGGNGSNSSSPSPSATGSAPGSTTSKGAGVAMVVEVTGLIGVFVAMGFAAL